MGTTTKWIYSFGRGGAEGGRELKSLLGGKGANLAEMCNLGIPVPPGFTISTEACVYSYSHDGRYPDGFEAELDEHLARLEAESGARFGDAERPLLVSVRSGARASMPGMMDTVLNIGLNAATIAGMIAATGNERLVYDSYRRFVQMYGDVVLGMKPESKTAQDPFEVVIERTKVALGVRHDTELSAGQLGELAEAFKAVVLKGTGRAFPDDAKAQLLTAINAVFSSWNNDRAVTYRRLNHIPDDWGTAVNVQAMVFGNMGDDSGTGVAFTRNPATGEKQLYGEFLTNAQGEDVVAGIRTPIPIARLRDVFPGPAGELEAICRRLETHYRDLQDVEFTVQRGQLFMLQTRDGKRTGAAAVRVAVDMVEEGLITPQEAVTRVKPAQLEQLLRPVFDEPGSDLASERILATGLNAGPGAATGRIVFHASDAEDWARRGEQVILVRLETSPEDIRGMHAAAGILTARGGMTSHAALVARQMGKVCVVGVAALEVDYERGELRIGDRVFSEGDHLSLNGTTGQVIAGRVPTRPSPIVRVLIERDLEPEAAPEYDRFVKLMSWADAARRLGVRANADQPDQAAHAVAFGAEGIGLCRTEHMFFGGDRIAHVREMILAETAQDRGRALAALLPMQRADFEGLFRVMAGRPVTIRTLDPPLHEFLPRGPADVAEVAALLGLSVERVEHRLAELHESNPMLGHRGCRLGITFPEVTAMQTRAIFEAACRVAKDGVAVEPEVMIPLVGHAEELRRQREVVERVAQEVMATEGVTVPYRVGTMIELPRAALTADQLALHADFFSFGTNDLTQTTFGLSRDDAGSFLPGYVAAGILPADPFVTLDIEGVGQLVRIGVERGRQTNAALITGLCGEHGGDPHSVAFCHEVGLDYVSCSPFRLPIARLAAARAALGV